MRRSHETLLLLVLGACTACESADRAPAARPQLAKAIDLAYCLGVIASGTKPEPARCPGFLVDPLKEALETCGGAGGKLRPADAANVWSLDVNGDNRNEFLYEHDGNVNCEGAVSIFSCGSLGCPKNLYQEQDGAWRVIGWIFADAMDAIELLDSSAGQGYRDLKTLCIGEGPCAEYSYYRWVAAAGQYDRSHLEVRGFRVEFGDSIHGLYGLAGETAVLATPARDAEVIGHYGSDTEVAVIGTAEGGSYYYVSPCNACESGFVGKSAVRVP